MKLKTLKTKSTLTLEGDVDAYSANQLKEMLVEALDAGNPLTIEAEKVERIDTVCSQLLISAQHSFHTAKVDMEITAPSESMHANLSTLGLKDQLLGKEEGTA